ncbi:MAG: hypothetical protein ACLGIZ_17740 [Acidimicrobiia bacterium]
MPFVAALAVMLLALGAATLTGTSTAHRSMMDHVAAAAADSGAPDSDHEDTHPGMGTHLAGACSAILAAALIVLAIRRKFSAVTEPAGQANVGPALRPRAARLWAAARGGPLRLALCVELR